MTLPELGLDPSYNQDTPIEELIECLVSRLTATKRFKRETQHVVLTTRRSESRNAHRLSANRSFDEGHQ